MNGTIVHPGKNRWALVLDLGTVDGKRKQKWITFQPSAEAIKSGVRAQWAEAKAKLAELLSDTNKGTYIEPSKLTLGAYLTSWLEQSIKPLRRPATYETYACLVRTHVSKAPIAGIPLQRLRASDIERFYAELTLAPGSVAVIHALLHRSLKKAVKDRLLTANPAVDLERRRVTADPGEAARQHCWTAVEARRVLEAAKTADPQLAAYTSLALDCGARKSELDGLGWEHLDLDTGTLTICRQLDRAGAEPLYGPTKTKKVRQVTLGAETVVRLRAHKAAQAALKMKNRTVYQDCGLIFAREDRDLTTGRAQLGQPIETLSRRVEALAKAAGVRRIKFHGLRHTVATLSLQAGTLPHVVAARLGHDVMMLMRTYAHALPDQQVEAAARLGALLHG